MFVDLLEVERLAQQDDAARRGQLLERGVGDVAAHEREPRRELRRLRADGVVERRPGHARHPVVAQDRVGWSVGPDDREGLVAGRRDDRLVAEPLQDPDEEVADRGLVVEDEDPRGPRSLARCLAAGSAAAGPAARGRPSPRRGPSPGAAPRAAASGRPPPRAGPACSWRSSGRRGSVRMKWLNAMIAARRLPSSWRSAAVAASRAGSRAGSGGRLSACGSCTRVSYDRVRGGRPVAARSPTPAPGGPP